MLKLSLTACLFLSVTPSSFASVISWYQASALSPGASVVQQGSYSQKMELRCNNLFGACSWKLDYFLRVNDGYLTGFGFGLFDAANSVTPLSVSNNSFPQSPFPQTVFEPAATTSSLFGLSAGGAQVNGPSSVYKVQSLTLTKSGGSWTETNRIQVFFGYGFFGFEPVDPGDSQVHAWVGPAHCQCSGGPFGGDIITITNVPEPAGSLLFVAAAVLVCARRGSARLNRP